MDELTRLRQENERYKKLLGVGEFDPVKNAFSVLVKQLNQQSKYLDEFEIKAHIGDLDKENPKYKRSMDMLESLPKMITAVNDLRTQLKITLEDIENAGKEKTNYARITTPEVIADQIGELAGGNR